MNRRTFLMAQGGALAPQTRMTTPGSLAYEIWDVFTSERFSGNPLAVFPDATTIPEVRLGAIAREMAHSETTFVYPRASTLEAKEGVRTRIFSRAGTELPFAGHPVLGTAFALWTVNRKRTASSGESIQLQLPIGMVPVVFQGSGAGIEGVMTQPEPVFAETHEAKKLAPLLGLDLGDIETSVPIQNVSTGRPNVLVMVQSRAAIKRAVLDWRGLDAYFASGDRDRGIYLMTRDVEQSSASFHARKPTRVGDDPVTGSAGGCAMAWLVKHNLNGSGKRVVIEQGSEVQRRGEMFGSAEMKGDKVWNVKVGGKSVQSAKGVIDTVGL